MEKLRDLPKEVTLAYLVAEDSEFLTGQILECGSAKEAVDGFRAISSVAKNSIPAIGFMLHVAAGDVSHYFFTKHEKSPDYDINGVGFEYRQVREAVEEVFALAKQQGLWDGAPEPTVRLWARIGMSLEVPRSTYERLREMATDRHGRLCDVVLHENLLSEFLDHGFADGESYVPADEFEKGGDDLC